MEHNRRSFLGVIGSLVLSPTMFVQETDDFRRADPELISTGFSQIDDAFGGGLKRGDVHSIIGGCGSGKTAMARSMMVKAACQCAVGYLPDDDGLFEIRGDSSSEFNGQLSIYPGELHNNSYTMIEDIIKNNDMVVFDNIPSLGRPDYPYIRRRDTAIKIIQKLAVRHGTCIIYGTTTRTPIVIDGWESCVIGDTFGGSLQFFSSGSFCMEKMETGFNCRTVKNRRHTPRPNISLELQPNLTFKEQR